MILVATQGLRVTHDRALQPFHQEHCGDAHRNGVLTGVVEDGPRGRRAEVRWDCGHVRRPLMWLLRVAEPMSLGWYKLYRDNACNFATREVAEAYHAFGLAGWLAAAWASKGFLPNEARPWIMAGIGPVDAGRMADEFGTVEQALADQARRELAALIPC